MIARINGEDDTADSRIPPVTNRRGEHRISLEAATQLDTDFCRRVHHEAYRDVVIRQFGSWDESLQDNFFLKVWNPARFDVIRFNDEPAGCMCRVVKVDHIWIEEIQLLPTFQGRGIGSEIMRGVMDEARLRSLAVRLQVLKANERACLFYERLGFHSTGETNTHFLMEWTCDTVSTSTENPMPSHNDVDCECGKPEKYATDPTVPVEFDEIMNEFHLVRDGSKLIMRYCTWCGGRLPKSKRDLFFTEPNESERAEVMELMKGARSHDDLLRILGPADELSESSGQVATPGNINYARWSQTYLYKTRWKSLELWVPLVIEGKFQFWTQGHPLSEPRSPAE